MIKFISERNGIKIEHEINDGLEGMELLQEFCRFMQSLTFAEKTVEDSVLDLAELIEFERGDVGEIRK